MSDLFINKFKFKKNRNHLRLLFLMILFFSLNLTGCFYSVTNWGEQINALNTDLDRELRKVNKDQNCTSSRFFKERMSRIEIEILDKRMNETFRHFFPSFSPIQQITERLKSEGGAKCLTLPSNSNDLTHTICKYSHEFVQGMREFGITGWKMRSAQWQKDNFQFELTSHHDHLVNSQGKVLEGECYEIDINEYATSKTIKFIRKLP